MRVDLIDGRYLLCGGILPKDKLAVGQLWAADDGPCVTITAITGDWVTYSRTQLNGQRFDHEKDTFSFQCRYCLVLDGPTIPGNLTD